MKVLLISFPRSGTELTLRILENNPQICKGFYATKLMRKTKTKEELISKYPQFAEKSSCAEQIIYEGMTFGDNTTDTPIMYCDRWNKYFGEQSKILHIVRHPYDVWNSLIVFLYLRRRWEHIIIKRLNEYFDCIQKYPLQIANYDNAFIFKYEDLLFNTNDIVKKIYNFCELPYKEFKEKMKVERAFWYKKIGHRIDHNHPTLLPYKEEFKKIFKSRIKETIDILNEVPGPKYEV